jgi:GTPase
VSESAPPPKDSTSKNLAKDKVRDAKPLDEIEKAIASGTLTLVVGPYLTKRAAAAKAAAINDRSSAARLEEAIGLAIAIDLTITEATVVPIALYRPATYLGKGKVEELKELIDSREIRLVVVDAALSPVQQRNLEKAWACKVIDRTGLILEIFGRRARTREGTLQVELAHLNYQKSRLVRSWTHLERQRGGFGFMGGPGETQIEADRRLIQDRMIRLEADLDAVKRTRGLHRASRKRVPYPIVALVGYTNAGKSSLFNRLTNSDVFAKDLLFATLDPTARAIKLPHGAPVMLSDTVGFISELPTMLVAAFRATLEDAIDADVLLHVRDVSHADSEAQAADVASILKDLGVPPEDHRRVIEVWNKSDLLGPADAERLTGLAGLKNADEQPVLVSALTGQGMDQLLALIEDRVGASRASFRLRLPPEDGQSLAWLHAQTEVISRKDRKDGIMTITVRVATEREGVFRVKFPKAAKL